MNETAAFALFIGLYMSAAGLGLLVDPKRYAAMIDEFRANAALTYLASMIALALGALIVTVHDVWTGPVAILVSLIGWAALVEGMLMLAFPQKFLDAFAPLARHERFMSGMGIATVAVGVLLVISAVA